MITQKPRLILLFIGIVAVTGGMIMYSKPLLIREPVTSLGLPHKPGVDSPDAGCQCQPDPQHDSVLPAADDSWDPSRFLLGPAAKNFRENLRNDTSYITSWSNAGFTNEFMSYVNMLYLATISERVPIIPPFAPDHHISQSAGVLSFGEIFNLEALRKVLRIPILEWSDVKDPSSPSNDPESLGCWSTRPANQPEPIWAFHIVRYLGLDVSYTRVPRHTRRKPEEEYTDDVVFFPLAALTFPVNPSHKSTDYPLMVPSPLGTKLSPDTHLTCFDLLYSVTSSREDSEWRHSWSPAWRFVGTHLKFTEPLLELSKAYVRRALQVTRDELPLFISVHVRHGDFGGQCWDSDTVKNCLAPFEAYARRVDEVKAELLVRRGVHVSRVLFTSDETDPAFWKRVTDKGWNFIDHDAEQTLEKYGEWYAPLIDVVAQSLGAGFVGTDGSTVSLVSGRRVQDWNQGVTRMVKWGKLGADDH